ncbi:AAA family ATPase [Desulfarculales bacterium]
MHNTTKFQGNPKPILPTILAGQNNLADFLIYRTSLPLASRVVARSHLAGVSLQSKQAYLLHTSKSQTSNRTSSSDQAVTTIQQGSGGHSRRANHLDRGAFVATAEGQTQVISPEHVRITATELI